MAHTVAGHIDRRQAIANVLLIGYFGDIFGWIRMEVQQ